MLFVFSLHYKFNQYFFIKTSLIFRNKYYNVYSFGDCPLSAIILEHQLNKTLQKLDYPYSLIISFSVLLSSNTALQ